MDHDRMPQVLTGEGANLDSFRQRQRQQQSLLSSSFASILRDHCVTPNECTLCNPTKVYGTWQQTTSQDEDPTTVFCQDDGMFCVTTERILFVSTRHKTNDVAVDATCIQLHAISNDNSIYIQFQNDDESAAPVDFTVTPIRLQEQDTCSTEEESTTIHSPQQQQVQVLFDALSKLVSLHPIPWHDDDDDDMDDDGDQMMMSSTDDVIFAAAAPTNNGNSNNVLGDGGGGGGGASEQEREAMLERLDEMLVVPPEFQVIGKSEHDAEEMDGQFEDAPEEDNRQETGVEGQFEDAEDDNDDDDDDAIL